MANTEGRTMEEELIDMFRRIKMQADLQPSKERLALMAQSPSDNYHWSNHIGTVRADRLSLMCDFAISVCENIDRLEKQRAIK